MVPGNFVRAFGVTAHFQKNINYIVQWSTMDIEESSDEARMILEKAIFTLENMIGNSCIDYGRLLSILKGKI